MSVYAPEIHTKTPDEVRKYDMDFAADLASGDSLTGTPIVSEETSTDLTITAVSISGSIAQCKISGGVDGRDYVVRWQVTTTTQSETLEALGRLQVIDG